MATSRSKSQLITILTWEMLQLESPTRLIKVPLTNPSVLETWTSNMTSKTEAEKSLLLHQVTTIAELRIQLNFGATRVELLRKNALDSNTSVVLMNVDKAIWSLENSKRDVCIRIPIKLLLLVLSGVLILGTVKHSLSRCTIRTATNLVKNLGGLSTIRTTVVNILSHAVELKAGPMLTLTLRCQFQSTKLLWWSELRLPILSIKALETSPLVMVT
jgi:hypothetical protein